MGFDIKDLLFFAPMILIMYFLIFLPKKKEQQAMTKMLAAMKKGDKVLTNSGMYGEVFALKDGGLVTLRFHDNVKIDFASTSITRILTEKDKETEKERAVEAKA
jgi:preprotein translocase subunit YajC